MKNNRGEWGCADDAMGDSLKNDLAKDSSSPGQSQNDSEFASLLKDFYNTEESIGYDFDSGDDGVSEDSTIRKSRSS